MPHNCLQCGGPVQKKPHESVKRYNAKKYCSTVCAKAWMKAHKVGWFGPDMQTIKKNNHPRYETYPAQTTDD